MNVVSFQNSSPQDIKAKTFKFVGLIFL